MIQKSTLTEWRWNFPIVLMLIQWTTLALSQELPPPIVPPELIYRAQAEGTVRVIAQLDGPREPEGRLHSSEAVTNQRKRIAMVQEGLLTELQNSRHRIARRFATIPFVALEVGVDALAMMERSRWVISVEEDSLSAPTLVQSVPLVEANQAWAVGFDGSGWTVAILDTGVDKNHLFLAGKVVAEACFSGNGNCPNGSPTQIGSGAGIPCAYAPNGCRHGTHVAGIAAGSGTSFSGVAKGANLIAVQVFSRFTGTNCIGTGEDPCTLSYISDQMAALEHIFTLRNSFQVASANMSLGGGKFTTQEACDAANAGQKAAIDNLRSVGIATVIASGNDEHTDGIGAPGCISSAVSVGSTTKSDQVSPFSNSASFLSLLAPGSSINSSVPGGGFESFNGTSMATPHVAGAWAILKQKSPTASVATILNALRSTGLPITDNRNGIITPRIRIAQALNFLSGPPTATPITLGQTASGLLSTSDSRSPIRGSAYYADRYTFAASAGQQIAITLTSADLDTYLYLLNPAGSVIAQDDDGGGGTNSRIPAGSGFFTLPSSETYTIEVTSFFQNATGNYTLSLSVPTACTYSISPTSRSITATGGTGNVNVVAPGGCTWAAASNADWVTITAGGNGNGNGTVTYSVAANTSINARTGTLTIAGRPFTVSQAGALNVLFQDNMEGGVGTWSWQDPWSHTTSTAHSPTHSWTDSPGGNYQNNQNVSLWSPIVHLTGLDATTLTFWHRYDLENGFDFGNVWVRPVGENFVQLRSFTGTNTTWQQVSLGLNAFVGQSIEIFFQLVSDSTITRDGWYIDDVLVTGTQQGAVLGIFRPSIGRWFVDTSQNGGTDIAVTYGVGSDIPIPGDYDGNGGLFDLAVFRPNQGRWFVDTDRNGTTNLSAVYGTAGDIPIPGDYNGDGRIDFAVFRPPLGRWFIDTNRDGVTDIAINYGTRGDIPVPADYNGDAITDLAVFRPSQGRWFVDTTRTGVTNLSVVYGTNNDIPLPADYNGDGIADLAVFRRSLGRWFIDTTRTGVTNIAVNYGISTDIPVPGDYNGDQIADIAVFRPSSGKWFLDTTRNGATDKFVNYGIIGDIPLRTNGWILKAVGLLPQ